MTDPREDSLGTPPLDYDYRGDTHKSRSRAGFIAIVSLSLFIVTGLFAWAFQAAFAVRVAGL